MMDYGRFYEVLKDTRLRHWRATLPQKIDRALRHGELTQWLEALDQLPAATPSSIDLNAGWIRIGEAADVDDISRGRLAALLARFHPWRKGPFCIFGIRIDTEWRSDWKWNRLKDAIAPLDRRRVLDVGCGNGYYGWRMLGAGALHVIGIDPTLRYVMQYEAIRHLMGPTANHVLPLRLADLPPSPEAFDTVFSMGVIYHRRDHLGHLRDLRRRLRDGGELVLEGLVVDGGPGEVLTPDGRYAKMKNVRAVPSCPTMEEWLSAAGFRNVRLVSVSSTTTAEQRRTPWMRFESLADFLDPADPSRTVEGHPAPKRAIFTAEK